MIDIALLREEKGGNPELVRESQRRRFKSVELVDQVIALDQEWRALRYRADNLNKGSNRINQAIKPKMKAKEPEGTNSEIPKALLARLDDLPIEDLEKLSVSQLKALNALLKTEAANAKEVVLTKEKERDNLLCQIGNIVHQDVPVSNDETNNGIVRTWGERRMEDGLFNHIELMTALDFMDTGRGTNVAGNRAYFLRGAGVLMKQALEQYAIALACRNDYVPIYVPFFMTKTVMSEVAQLSQFDDELYKVTGEGEDKYLIATSEQPIAAYHRGEWLDKELPIKYAGISTCFRKEVGSHGRDTLGIFRVHQFEKIEQFCYVSPRNGESWKMFDSMVGMAEKFYQSLELPYQVVNIVTGELNNAAAMKYDLEGWFPASKKFRELVSCSNCTDYQARRLGIRYGTTKDENSEKEHVHMLNATLCALTRVLCIILETNQTKEGVKVPKVLVPYMGGIEFLSFVTPPKKWEDKPKPTEEKKEAN
eukprot:c19696_g1_i1.p1 GENE.c19696_g1_i1~~c19696_g1_i1.p1  ORF type:complete len:480 (-),score=199.90 c19696_g1_i1:33-1472(-)